MEYGTWTNKEVEKLLKLYGRLRPEEMVDVFHRDMPSIRSKYYRHLKETGGTPVKVPRTARGRRPISMESLIEKYKPCPIHNFDNVFVDRDSVAYCNGVHPEDNKKCMWHYSIKRDNNEQI